MSDIIDQTNKKTVDAIFVNSKQKKIRDLSNERLKTTYQNARNTVKDDKEQLKAIWQKEDMDYQLDQEKKQQIDQSASIDKF